MSDINDMQALEAIANIMEKIPNENVYGTMRSMKLRRIRTPTVNYMRACLALHSVGLPITSNLVAFLTKTLPFSAADISATVCALHNLGDKHCIVLKRSDAQRRHYEWVVDPVFLEAYR